MRGGSPAKLRRVRGVTRMGLPPTLRTSSTNWARFAEYSAKLMLAAGFWSLWPN